MHCIRQYTIEKLRICDPKAWICPEGRVSQLPGFTIVMRKPCSTWEVTTPQVRQTEDVTGTVLKTLKN